MEGNLEERRRRVQVWLADTELQTARRNAGQALAEGLLLLGVDLLTAGHMIGPDRAQGQSSGGHGSDEAVGVATLAQVGGELCAGAVPALAGDQHYVGAALLRQLVEVEYLMWSFGAGRADAKTWLESDRSTRLKLFSPKALRDGSDGRFDSHDYANHCEEGGHPTPRAWVLLGGRALTGQLLLGDLLLHGWRICDAAFRWGEGGMFESIVAKRAGQARTALGDWSRVDPFYQAACEGWLDDTGD